MSRFPGIYVATTTPFADDLSLDLDRYRAHCRWLVEQGVDGLIPVGSLGEYESLSLEERRAVVSAAIEAADGRVQVVPGVSGLSSLAVSEHTQHAKDVGADGVMVLPPTNHSPTLDELLAHFSAVAEVGLPLIVYNNPFSTRVDLTPDILARLARIEGVVGVKEFSGDVRRVSEILEVAPDLEVLCGADDVALESALMGATGWIGGFTGVFPRETKQLFELGQRGEVAPALQIYRRMLPLLRWDSGPRFVEAIKRSIDLVGQPGGGAVRPPRLALSQEDDRRIEKGVAAVTEAR
jgi:1-pyrroline-4-hydroxy-2-carboxylate deaminase